MFTGFLDVLGYSVCGLILFCIVLLILLIRSMRKLKKMNAKYSKFMKDAVSGGNLDSVIDSLIDNDDAMMIKTREMSQQIAALKKTVSYCGQKISIVRYNAFADVGSDQSFSIAVLDERDNGVTITGIYARESSSIYAKPIQEGKSNYALSVEESQAIEKAKKEYRERV